MTDLVYDKIGGLEDSDWILKHCVNKLFSSPRVLQKLERFLVEGYVAGELDWSIQKWSEDIENEFGVKPYEGYMAYVGGDEHGYAEQNEYMSFHSTKLIFSELQAALNWYGNKHPEKLNEINKIKDHLVVLVP